MKQDQNINHIPIECAVQPIHVCMPMPYEEALTATTLGNGKHGQFRAGQYVGPLRQVLISQPSAIEHSPWRQDVKGSNLRLAQQGHHSCHFI